MKAFRAALAIVLLIFAQSTALGSNPDSVATPLDLDQSGGLGVIQADSTQPAREDTLMPSFQKDGGVMAKLVMPILVTAAAG
ncbi:MAG TPA: hypothetical protein VF398_10815, partial [bacterium]